MKKKSIFVIIIALSIILEAILCIVFINKIENVAQDSVKVNDCLKSIENNYNDPSKYLSPYDYVIIDNDGNILYRTKDNISDTINEAIINNDTILDIEVDGIIVGKLIIHNDIKDRIDDYKKSLILSILILSMVQIASVGFYFLYINMTITKPFRDLNSFAVRVASGNLDLPLKMDKGHAFGEFTEAFDLMRSELKKARIAEKKANDEKKEMVAKLSHDIKTPVASIKSTSEVGYEFSSNPKVKDYFNNINIKSDQIKTLVDNLFNSSVEEVTEISVTPSNYQSDIIKDLIINADYLLKAKVQEIPPVMVYIDKLRLQQTFDNIIMNSYKYANTDILVSFEVLDGYLVVSIRDYGEGVSNKDLPFLKDKYRRGSNTGEKDGAGLGLYISSYFIEKMNGRLELSNASPGFLVKLYLRII